jgi:hypothetical protein
VQSAGMHTIAKVLTPSFSPSHTAAGTETLYAVLVPDTVWVEEPMLVFYRTHMRNYMHALVDDYLGALRLRRPYTYLFQTRIFNLATFGNIDDIGNITGMSTQAIPVCMPASGNDSGSPEHERSMFAAFSSEVDDLRPHLQRCGTES